jgi:hypothetical protein
MNPKKGLGTKTDWLTIRQPQCDFDFAVYYSRSGELTGY